LGPRNGQGLGCSGLYVVLSGRLDGSLSPSSPIGKCKFKSSSSQLSGSPGVTSHSICPSPNGPRSVFRPSSSLCSHDDSEDCWSFRFLAYRGDIGSIPISRRIFWKASNVMIPRVSARLMLAFLRDLLIIFTMSWSAKEVELAKSRAFPAQAASLNPLFATQDFPT
jgi:hypothetical protein